MSDAEVLNTLIGLRKAAGLSQKQAAKILGVDRKAISSWETGNAIPEKRHRPLFLKYLLEDLNLKDNADVFESVWQDVASGLWGWEPLNAFERWTLHLAHGPSPSSISVPSLPPFLNVHPLIGRNTLITELKQLILSKRSVALIGIPGVGKTALAVTIAEDSDIVNRFKDGVLWASLGQRPDILGTLAQWGNDLKTDVSGYPTPHQRSQALKSVISQRHILLIIDDAWDSTAVELLQCGGHNCCHLLITRLQSLAESFATAEQVVRVVELDDESGYQLLSRLAPHAWEADQVSAKALVQSVGGLPLALKVLGGYLAAPERRFFSSLAKSNITDLMDPRRRLYLALKRLGAENSRPVTIQQVIELSLDDLPRQVIQTYFNLGAFAAKPAFFTRQAAEVVTVCETTHLSLLIDRNLLEIGVKEQLTLHQVLADFARASMQLAMINRHFEYYLDVANKNYQDWRQIDIVYQQLRWAWHQHTLSNTASEKIFELLTAVRLYQYRRGLWDDILEWTEAALKIAREKNHLDQVATILTMRGDAYKTLGDRAEAIELYKEALDLRRHLGDTRSEAILLQNIATVFHYISYFQEALEYYQQALLIFEQCGDLPDQASVLSNLGQLHSDLDMTEDALEYLHQALSIRQQINDQEGQAASLVTMAGVHINMSNPHEAIAYLYQALAIAQHIGNRGIEAKVFHNLSTAYFHLKDISKAIDCSNKALIIYQETKARPDEARILFSIGSFYRALGEIDKVQEYAYKEKALNYYYDALMIQAEVLDRFGKMNTLGYIGTLHEDVENWDTALKYYEEGLDLAVNLNNRLDEAALLQKIGDVLYKTGKYQQAEGYYQKAIKLVVQYGTLNQERSLRLLLMRAYKQLGDIKSAYEYMQRVIEIDHLLHHSDLTKDQEWLVYLYSLLTD